MWRNSWRLSCVAVLLVPTLADASPMWQREWTLNDSIEMTYFSDDQNWPELWPARREEVRSRDPAVIVSPDGEYFFVVTHQGVLERDSNVYELTVYEARSVRHALSREPHAAKPRVSVSYETTSSNSPALVGARWLQEGHSITYWGTRDDQLQLYRLDVESGAVTQLSDFPRGTPGLDGHFPKSYLYRDGSAVVTPRKVTTQHLIPASYPIVLAKRPPEGGASVYADPNYPADFTYLLTQAGGTLRLDGVFTAWSIQPGGRKAVAIREMQDEKGRQTEKRFVLVDLERGVVAPMLSTDVGSGKPLPAPHAEWASGGDTVTLINTLIPSTNPADSSAGKMAGVVSFNIGTGAWKQVKWNAPPKDAPAARPELKGLSAFVRQSANDPPVLIAGDGKQEIALISVAKLISGIRRAPVESISWTEEGGATVVGELLSPIGVDRNVPAPLVIEVASHILPASFFPDGRLSAAYASQVYAAQGFAVLRVPNVNRDLNREGTQVLKRLDAAIDAAAARLSIDRSRIGAIGHSRTGFQVLYSVTHPGKQRLAAAAVIDSFLGTYASYLADGGLGFLADPNDVNYTGMTGGPFWDHKREWLEHESTFGIDRVATPALFALHAPPDLESAAYGANQILGAFNLNRRPIEYMWIPQASHLLYRPRERLAEMGTVLQWMKFWLKDETPSDRDLAARWAPLRELQKSVLSQRSAASSEEAK